jgi:hypothetical protein
MRNNFLSTQQITELLGVRTHRGITLLVRAGKLTKPLKLSGGHANFWIKSEIDAIINARIAGASNEEIVALVAELHLKRGGGAE